MFVRKYLIHPGLEFVYFRIRSRDLTVVYIKVVSDIQFGNILFVVLPCICLGIVSPSRWGRRGIYFPVIDVIFGIIGTTLKGCTDIFTAQFKTMLDSVVDLFNIIGDRGMNIYIKLGLRGRILV